MSNTFWMVVMVGMVHPNFLVVSTGAPKAKNKGRESP